MIKSFSNTSILSIVSETECAATIQNSRTLEFARQKDDAPNKAKNGTGSRSDKFDVVGATADAVAPDDDDPDDGDDDENVAAGSAVGAFKGAPSTTGNAEGLPLLAILYAGGNLAHTNRRTDASASTEVAGSILSLRTASDSVPYARLAGFPSGNDFSIAPQLAAIRSAN